MSLPHRLTFWWRYLRGRAPWDTNTPPPELVHLIEQERLPAGRVIDLGCGTGTNTIYLAGHGWQGVGIDFVGRAIRQARRKASRAGVAERVRFVRGDVTRLEELGIAGPFDLALDIGCAHSLTTSAQARHAANLARVVRRGGLFMLYMFCQSERRPDGLPAQAVEDWLRPHFRLVWSSLGEDRAAQTSSAWYRFERTDDT